MRLNGELRFSSKGAILAVPGGTVIILPTHIPVPVSTAASFRLQGDLGAKDLAYAVAVAHLAALAEPDPQNRYLIPDNRLRGELGQHRRETIKREHARFARLRDAAMPHPRLGPVPVPTVATRTLGTGEVVPNTNNRDDELSWVVDPLMRELFIPTRESVMLPVDLLRTSTNRHTVTLVLRLLALMWQSAKEVKRSGPGYVLVHVKPDRIADVLGLPLGEKAKPSRAMFDFFNPIMADLSEHTGIVLEAAPVYARTRSAPQGRVHYFEIYMSMPQPSALERKFRLAEIEPVPETSRPATWRTKPVTPPKAAKPASKPEPRPGTTNVTELRRPSVRPQVERMRAFKPSAKTGDGDGEVTF